MEQGHGRVEWRELTMTTALRDYLDWPGAQQVFRVARRVVTKRTGGDVRIEAVYARASCGWPTTIGGSRTARIGYVT